MHLLHSVHSYHPRNYTDNDTDPRILGMFCGFYFWIAHISFKGIVLIHRKQNARKTQLQKIWDSLKQPADFLLVEEAMCTGHDSILWTYSVGYGHKI